MRLSLLLYCKVAALTLFILGVLAFNPSHRNTTESPSFITTIPVSLHAATPSAPSYDEFNIHTGLYRREDFRVKRNDTFSDILTRHGLSHATVAELVKLSKSKLDVRKIRAGNSYSVYQDTSASGATAYLVYEKDPIDYVVFSFSDSLRVDTASHPITTKRSHVQGVIKGSLYETLQEQEINPLVAITLSEIFAWQVDFYRIMKGDQFSVIFEEEFVGDRSIGVGSIIAAHFVHNGDSYYAFPFEIDGATDYYDAEGNSLRRPFLKAPLRFSRISSRYSLRRFHPVQKRYKAHLGTDYAAPTGTPVHSTADGIVVDAGYTRGNGRYVKVKHNGTYTTGYLHFSKIAKGIRKGVKVKQGDVIGYVGSTGLATGPHLCYRFWKNGRQVDPLREKLPATIEPIQIEYREAFLAYVETFRPTIDGERLAREETILHQTLLDDLLSYHTP